MKTILKAAILSLLALCILLCAPCCSKKSTTTAEAPPASSDKFEFSLSSATAQAGQEVKIQLSIENNPTIAGYSVTVCYDPQVLTFNSCENQVAGGFAVTNSTEEGKVRVMCTVMGGNTLSHEGISDELTFTVKKDAPKGESALNLIFADDADMVYQTQEDGKMPTVACVLQGGILTVE